MMRDTFKSRVFIGRTRIRFRSVGDLIKLLNEKGFKPIMRQDRGSGDPNINKFDVQISASDESVKMVACIDPDDDVWVFQYHFPVSQYGGWADIVCTASNGDGLRRLYLADKPHFEHWANRQAERIAAGLEDE